MGLYRGYIWGNVKENGKLLFLGLRVLGLGFGAPIGFRTQGMLLGLKVQRHSTRRVRSEGSVSCSVLASWRASSLYGPDLRF